MKKSIVWLLVIFILTLSCIYLFIPAKIVISGLSTASVTMPGEFRSVSQEGKWEQWWRDSDGKPHIKGEPFSYNGSVFRLTKHFNNVAGIDIDHKGIKLQSMMHLVSFSMDSTGTIWECEMPETYNPLTRILYYKHAIEIKKNMNGVMKNFIAFISVPENVYGISIHRTSTSDTTLLSLRFITAAYPTTTEVYKNFDALEKTVLRQKGIVTGFPMMNVRKMENDSFETQVALPTNKILKNEGQIVYRRMIPGYFLTAHVKGGTYTINEALKQLEFFLSDYNKARIANPFQSLVTNRIKEPDTSKWITKLYYPIVQ